MNIIGINYGHNATLCLIRDGRIVFCQSEERFNRIKNTIGFPRLTLEHVYKNIIGPDSIDAAVLYQNSVYGYIWFLQHGFDQQRSQVSLNPQLCLQKNLKRIILKTEFGWNLQKARIASTERNRSLKNAAQQYFSDCLNIPSSRIMTVDHHLAHAYSVVPNIRGWDKTLIFTLDGVGDWKCATVNVWQADRMTQLSATDHRNSLGYLYSLTTELLGMKPNEHEFKVMGLAPYAKERYYRPVLEKLERLLYIDGDGSWRCRVNPIALREQLETVYRYQRFDNVAGAVQALTEERIVEWVRYWIAKTGIRRIALAGGVFMNVKACQKLLELREVERLFVVPSAADESAAIGSAVWGSLKIKAEPVEEIKDIYWGVSYGDEDISGAIRDTDAAQRYDITTPKNVNEKVAELLAANQVVARCSGKMEFGARALGNRSILANPSRIENLNFINEAIKSRDFWMPFTPSILEDDMPRYVRDYERMFAPYMVITFNSTAEARRDLAAAIHPKDFTLRPQCVRRDYNPGYFEVIEKFKGLTGIGAVLNTSFNLHGEPNVCSPFDAIRTVDNSGLNYLAMGKFLLKKKNVA